MDEDRGFGLFRGGLLRALGRLTHLVRDDRRDVVRLSVALALIAWAPVVVLGVVDRMTSGQWDPVLLHVEIHVRWLVAVPLLFAAERLVDERIGLMTRYLTESGIVPTARLPDMRRLERRVAGVCDSAILEVVLLALAVALSAERFDGATTPAHWWDALVELPVYRFLLLRWLHRWLMWTALMVGIARGRLDLIGLHPDRAGGLGVLVQPSRAFGLVILAIGGVIACDLYMRQRAGVAFNDLAPIIWVYVGLMVVLAVLPLVAFVPALTRAKHAGLIHFGLFAQNYVHEFRERWLERPTSGMLGSSDIQSLNDLGGSHNVLREMRLVPFPGRFVGEMAAIALFPILPLYLQSVSIGTIVGYLVKALF